MLIRSMLLVLTSLLWSLSLFAVDMEAIDKAISKMSTKQKAGQLLILGFTGTDYRTSLKKQIDYLNPGAVIIFGRNIESLQQLKSLNELAQKESLKRTKIPLLIAVDQEGGNVLRIKTSPSLPSARTLALTENTSLVQEAGYVTGKLMSALGFNMNLAPVVDVSSPEISDFLGSRSFSHQKDVVSTMSTAFSRGLVDAGIMPTAKHFPGHGGVSVDSHLATPYKQVTLTELLFNDLSPYKEMQQQRIPFAIMASHISYPLIDPSKRPASFSPILLDQVLRNTMGFEGILLTDDIQMEGAKDGDQGVGERAVDAVLAGNDLVMVGWNLTSQKRAHDALAKAISSGKISQQRLNQSLRRILIAKKKFYNPPTNESLKATIARLPLQKTYGKIFHEVLERQSEKISLSNQPTEVFSYSWQFINAFKHNKSTRRHHLKNFKNWNSFTQSNQIIFHLSGPTTAKILKSCPSELLAKVIVVNTSNETQLPYPNDRFAGALNIHSNHPQLGQLVAQYLSENGQREQRSVSSKPGKNSK